jgi:hypothetical protein
MGKIEAKTQKGNSKNQSIIVNRQAYKTEICRGWMNSSLLANISTKIKKVDSWLRNRLRYCIWHDWKKPDRKLKNLI